MTDILSAAEKLADHNDRLAFFFALLALAAFGGVVVKYLASQNAALVSELSRSHELYRTEMKEITRGVQSCLDANTHQLAQNTEILSQTKTALAITHNRTPL